MAKKQPDALEALEPETEYLIKKVTEGVFAGHWVIYTNTKWGDKWFMNFPSEEQAKTAAKTHKLTLLL